MIFLSRPAYRLVAVIAFLAGPAVLFAGPTVAARPGSPELLVSDTRLAGPGVDISVIIPADWHRIPGPRPQILQMIYPATCAGPGLGCASAFALIGSGQDFSAQTAAEVAERTASERPLTGRSFRAPPSPARNPPRSPVGPATPSGSPSREPGACHIPG